MPPYRALVFARVLALGLAFAGASGAAPATPACPLDGLTFGPYVGEQDPADGIALSEAQLAERLALLAGRARWVRSYGSTHGLEAVGRLAHAAGFEAAIGAWLGPDPAANESELASLVSAAAAGEVDVAVVGSEAVLRGDLSAGELVTYLERARAALPAAVPVTTAEPDSVWLAHPELALAVDVVYVHLYPFFAGEPIEDAILSLHRAHRRLAAAVAPKPVVIAETGWPSAGEPLGAAEPSPKNAASYLVRFVSWAEANGVPYLYFAAFDEPWKVRVEGERGEHWGAALANGRPKKGLRQALRCKRAKRPEPGLARIPDAETPGAPSLTLRSVPPLGSSADLHGRTSFLVPADFAVAVYVFEPGTGGWWTKPTFTAPLTPLAADGAFRTDVTTGGADASATRIAAFLVPWSYEPPLAAGLPELPAELTASAVDSEIVER